METLSRHAKIQTSETFLLSAILALSGDFRMRTHTMCEMAYSRMHRPEMLC